LNLIMTAALKSLSRNVALAAMALVLMALSSQVKAATLAEYRARVSEAATVLLHLQAPGANAGDGAQGATSADISIARLKTLLPEKERVILNDQAVEVNNSWLHEGLREFEKNQASVKRSEQILRRIQERLQALEQRIDEMQSGKPASDKDANKARLAEILLRPEYNKSAGQGSAITRLWERFLRWLSSLFPKTKPLQPGTGRALSTVAQVVVVALCVAVIAFFAWKFLPRYLSNRGKKKTKREARIVLGERLEPDQTAADLLEQAEALARAGDLRGAIRKAYIALLCELGDRKVISLAQHKTNRDYLMSVRDKSPLYQSMRRLTSSFELHWYGFVPPAPNDWDEFRVGCRNAVTSDK
jgi:hypothetical protein